MSDLNVSAVSNQLTISGKCVSADQWAVDNDCRATRTERRHGLFTRTFSLVEGTKIDQIKSKLHNGVLTVHIPKVETERGSMAIPIHQVKSEPEMNA